MPDAAEILDIAYRRHAQELRETWQGRILAEALVLVNGVARPRDVLGAIVASILAHNFDEAMPIMLRVCLPGYESAGTPMLCSAARIAKSGQVMADIITRTGQRFKGQMLFRNERALERWARALADRHRFSDQERLEFFSALKRWVVCDYRLDPTMHRDDPDAKRLVH